MRRRWLRHLPWPATLVAVVVGTAVLAACETPGASLPAAEAELGDPDRGKALIREYGCGSCHVIPGLEQANGVVGPPLTQFGRRMYIAGAVPNNPENLQLWIIDPQVIEPGTAMPDLDVSVVDARDIASYLLTLE